MRRSIDLCFDYSFWQSTQNRCSSMDEIEKQTHPSFCRRQSINCFDTKHRKYCKDTSASNDCNDMDDFFCKVSKTCIPWGNEANNIGIVYAASLYGGLLILEFYVYTHQSFFPDQLRCVMGLFIVFMGRMKHLKIAKISILKKQLESA